MVEQIVEGIRRQIAERQLRPGSKLPSIRAFARTHNISRFTVVEAYDRLVALGCVRSRRGAGFFTTAPDARDAPVERNRDTKRNEAMVWLIRRLLEARDGTVLAGGPWLPDAWLDEANIRRAIRALAGRPGRFVTDYGDPYGYRPLREHIVDALLPEIGIAARPAQILLTTGGSQALDLVSRSLLGAGDVVLVDDPGYYNLFGNLRLQGVRLVGVPRTADGPDVDALEAMAAEYQPKLFFTQSVLQNPTGTTMSAHVAYRVLQIAGRHGFRVVEDDTGSDLQAEPATRLAALDQLDRVIYIRSFSKTLSGSLRVGFVASDQRLIDDLADTKMVTCITSSQFTEKVLYHLLTEGHYRKFVARLRERIAEARCDVARAFDAMGIEVFTDSDVGMFLWARFPGIDDSLPLAERALKSGVMLAPGTVFRPNLEPSPWLRFNVAICAAPEVRRRVKRIADAFADA
ncbi:MAG: PLP-dependent aminotransferase family protein [Candidatus Eiseniibacteriota bacterium]